MTPERERMFREQLALDGLQNLETKMWQEALRETFAALDAERERNAKLEARWSRVKQGATLVNGPDYLEWECDCAVCALVRDEALAALEETK